MIEEECRFVLDEEKKESLTEGEQLVASRSNLNEKLARERGAVVDTKGRVFYWKIQVRGFKKKEKPKDNSSNVTVIEIPPHKLNFFLFPPINSQIECVEKTSSSSCFPLWLREYTLNDDSGYRRMNSACARPAAIKFSLSLVPIYLKANP